MILSVNELSNGVLHKSMWVHVRHVRLAILANMFTRIVVCEWFSTPGTVSIFGHSGFGLSDEWCSSSDNWLVVNVICMLKFIKGSSLVQHWVRKLSFVAQLQTIMLKKLSEQTPYRGPRLQLRGFTAIELLVTIAVLGVLLALAMPSFTDFAKASRGSTFSSNFVAGMTRARTEAISQNVCVKICQSANVNTVGNAASSTCVTTGDDWQRGWIIFRVPDCSTNLNNPVDTDVLAARLGEYADFRLFTTSGTVRRFFVFDPKGVMLTGVGPNLTMTYVPDGVSSKHTRSVCVSIAGRVTVREYGGVDGCSN